VSACRRVIARGLIDDHAGAGHERELVGVGEAEFAGAGELDVAAVEAGAHHQVIVAAENLLRVGRLSRAAVAVG
jgi:hypothetical protein